jgi:broad-specificity NMP kinase
MFNVCVKCGSYRVDKKIEMNGSQSFAICPDCNHSHHFLQLPLFIVTGASGTGKSTIALELLSASKQFVSIDSDVLWDNRYNSPESNYKEYRELWLRMAKNISQSGKPLILCGTAMPEQFESCLERRYFSKLHYLALVCDNAELETRLKSRPSWRESGNQDFINGMVSYNGWLIENGPNNEPKIDLLDTTNDSPGATAKKIISWGKEKI